MVRQSVSEALQRRTSLEGLPCAALMTVAMAWHIQSLTDMALFSFACLISTILTASTEPQLLKASSKSGLILWRAGSSVLQTARSFSLELSLALAGEAQWQESPGWQFIGIFFQTWMDR